MPFDARRGIIPNAQGRVLHDGQALAGIYCAGWIKRGPSGIIGTNRADAIETAAQLLSDFTSRDDLPAKPGASALLPLLASRGLRCTDFQDWLKVDAAEIARGAAVGKPREKFVRIKDVFDSISDQAAA
jgi:ferredoxin--NADP+ reductase